ncbi:hypothetical protein HanIR_Chr13g0650701 [Helianthus annuus]|nr:hypothetical protein HanIR_Chr13g0650701 [Helianthus annuus]
MFSLQAKLAILSCFLDIRAMNNARLLSSNKTLLLGCLQTPPFDLLGSQPGFHRIRIMTWLYSQTHNPGYPAHPLPHNKFHKFNI